MTAPDDRARDEQPAEALELPVMWFSPSLAAKSPIGQAYAGLMWRYESGVGYTTPLGLPADAVRVVAQSAPAGCPEAVIRRADGAGGKAKPKGFWEWLCS